MKRRTFIVVVVASMLVACGDDAQHGRDAGGPSRDGGTVADAERADAGTVDEQPESIADTDKRSPGTPNRSPTPLIHSAERSDHRRPALPASADVHRANTRRYVFARESSTLV